MERLKKFNIGVQGAKNLKSTVNRWSAAVGVKRKSIWVGLVGCQVPGCPYQSGFVDKISKFPHTPTCPRGHVQYDGSNQPVRMESEEAQEIARWGLYRDIAAGGEFGARNQVGQADNLITPLEFFNQGVNQQAVEDQIIAKRLRSIRRLQE